MGTSKKEAGGGQVVRATRHELRTNGLNNESGPYSTTLMRELPLSAM